MRKWMRERLQRRKKKTAEAATQPPPPPLQPAYFEADQSDTSAEDPVNDSAASTPAEPDFQGESERTGEPAPEVSDTVSSDQQASPSATKESTRGRSRRRRGGRGRGARGREKAVAQAFTPKGTMADVPVEEPPAEPTVETQPETEPEPASPAIEAPKPPAVPVAPQRPPKGIVVLAIGLPGSGKSTWFKRHNVTPLSSDLVRSLLFDDVREQRFQDLVFSNLRSMLKARLIAKRPMNYVDATNLTPQERQHWIKLAKDYNYEVHAVFFDVPLEVCLERHQRRDRVVPEDIMRRMAAKLKPPSFSEGFAKITVVRVKKKDEKKDE
jgi:predicted kinase